MGRSSPHSPQTLMCLLAYCFHQLCWQSFLLLGVGVTGATGLTNAITKFPLILVLTHKILMPLRHQFPSAYSIKKQTIKTKIPVKNINSAIVLPHLMLSASISTARFL